jgi:asparagine synthase (glutamine-hydrolysing)
LSDDSLCRGPSAAIFLATRRITISAIFGIFNLNGKPVDPGNLKRMQQAMDYWGPDGSGTWCEGPVGLGHLMLHNTQESLHETLPLRSESGDLVLTAGARLDNREALFRALQVPASEQALMPDSALILKACQKWGTECPAHLLGDWAFALWDIRRRQLFLARDHFGVSGLYYLQYGYIFVFASSLKGILALPEAPRILNPAAMQGAGFKGDAATPYRGVYRLPPAQALRVTAKDTKLWHYWQLKDIPDVRFNSDQDYLDAFLEIYTEAVRCRLRSHRPIGLMLSGGLDSGSIAVLASREFAGRGRRLAAYSAIPLYDITRTTPKNRCGDESLYIEATCKSAHNIDLTYVKAEDITPLVAVEAALDIHELPQGNANYTWIIDILAKAQQKNIGVMLDGWGGNFTVSWTGNHEKYLSGLMKKGRWNAYIQEVNACRKANHIPVWRAFMSSVAKPFIRPVWQEQFRRFCNRNRKLIRKDLIRSMRKNDPVMTIDYEATNALNPGLFHYFRNGHTARSFELAAAFGMESRQPAMDKRLIEFCLGIPQYQYIRNGQNKMLIRRAMAGMMPESVLWNDRRGKQSADIGQRIRASRSEVEMALQKLRSSKLASHYLKTVKLDDAFRILRENVDSTTTIKVSSRLLRGLSIGIFLHRFEDA